MPLYVYNGVIVTKESEEIQGIVFDSLIHQVEILKNAYATALFSSRGVNGVILITDEEYRKKAEKLKKRRQRKRRKKN